MILRELAGKIKVGDVLWLKFDVTDIGNQDDNLENRHFDSKDPFPNGMLGANVYGDTEVVFQRPEGLKSIEQSEIIKIKDEKVVGMVEAYEKVLFGNRKLTLE